MVAAKFLNYMIWDFLIILNRKKNENNDLQQEQVDLFVEMFFKFSFLDAISVTLYNVYWNQLSAGHSTIRIRGRQITTRQIWPTTCFCK